MGTLQMKPLHNAKGGLQIHRSIIVVQPAVPTYRRGLFSRLAAHFGPGFSVYASRQEDLGVLAAEHGDDFAWLRPLGEIRPLAPGIAWQAGALTIPVLRGDVLVVCGAPRTLSTLALIVKGKLRGAHTIWWGHYWSATSQSWRAAIRFALMRLPDAIIFYTEQEVNEYNRRGGGAIGKPVFGLNNGIETNEIKELRTSYRPDQRPTDLLFIGRITPKAELGLLLEAMALPESNGVTLEVIGDGKERAPLQHRAAELGLDDRIFWLGSMTEEAKIASVANRCKAFVYPGSVGLSLIHGFAYGLPAIVHDDRWTQMPEIAAHQAGKTGVTFKKGDAQSLAEALSSLVSDHSMLEKMSTQSVAITDRTFNTADMAERFCSAIAEISALS